MAESIKKGKVKFYNDVKAYGFIACEDGEDYFFHLSGIANKARLIKDDKVTFKLETGNRGLKAVEIEKVV